MRRALGIAAAAFVLAACSGDSNDDSGAAEDAGDQLTDLANGAENAEPCADLFGRPTAEAIEATCTDENGGLQMMTSASMACPDGRALHWNDYGWGYNDGAWQVHARPDGQLVPPDADMAACET